MTDDTLEVTAWEVASWRGAVYRLLARALAYPTRPHLVELREQLLPVVGALASGDAELDHLLAEVSSLASAPDDELRAAHALVFTHIEPVDSPPYESAYASADVFRQTDVMADVAGFYRAHGVKVGGMERERPDHIATELEFMGFLAHKEAHALVHLGPEQVAECRRTEAHFLADHLGCWGEGFGRRLALVASHTFYRSIGRLLAGWLGAEATRAGVTPAASLDTPFPPPAPDDGSCGLDDTCPVAGPGGEAGVELGPPVSRPR